MPKKLQVGDLVSLNKQPDGAVFKVRQIDGFTVGLVDASHLHLKGVPQPAMQWTDTSLVHPATAPQLKNLLGQQNARETNSPFMM